MTAAKQAVPNDKMRHDLNCKRAKERAAKLVKQLSASSAILATPPNKQDVKEGPDISTLADFAAIAVNLQQYAHLHTTWGADLSKLDPHH